MCFLPLTHIFERGWTMVCLMKGTQVAVNRDPKRIQKSLKEVCPTVMCSVPRFWEKVYIGVQEKIEHAPGPMHSLFESAIATGRAYHLDYKRKGLKPPMALQMKYNLYQKTVFRVLKQVLGLQNGRFFPVAGAPWADRVLELVRSVAFPRRNG